MSSNENLLVSAMRKDGRIGEDLKDNFSYLLMNIMNKIKLGTCINNNK